MFNATLWLTLATLAGLAAGFGREWLLVYAWGAGGRSDAFLVALFLPEALRMTLAAGILSAAALPLYRQSAPDARLHWLTVVTPRLFLTGLACAAAVSFAAPLLTRLVGPGLSADMRALATHSLTLLAWCAPGFMLQALFTIPLQAASRFTLAGLGSLAFNLPPVLYLALCGKASTAGGLALSCLAGSLLMPALLAPSMFALGWRPWRFARSHGETARLFRQLGPLLVSNVASQGLALLERMIATFLGEGALTLVNLARKCINLPLIALMSMNQVLLGLMSGREDQQRLELLKRGLATATLLTLPAAVGLVATAPALVHFIFPDLAQGPLPGLLAWFAVPLVFGAWNALLARYAYAAGDTVLPLRCELAGSALNAALLVIAPFAFGIDGIALAALGGIVLTGLLLLRRQDLTRCVPWKPHWTLSIALLAAAALLLFPVAGHWLQLGLGIVAGGATLTALVAWLRPWRPKV